MLVPIEKLAPFFHDSIRTNRIIEPHAIALDAAFKEFGINTPLRIAAAIAQFAHETGGFRWLRELGGAAYLAKYDMRQDLGNSKKGDGARFRGRGYIQITGASNYQQADAALGIGIFNNPELAENPTHAARISAWWWNDRGLNELADKGDFRKITRVINGGYNGLSERERYYKMALELWTA